MISLGVLILVIVPEKAINLCIIVISPPLVGTYYRCFVQDVLVCGWW